MKELDQVPDLMCSDPGCKSVSPSNYWGLGNFGSQQETTSPESQEETLSEDQAETPLPTPPESKPS